MGQILSLNDSSVNFWFHNYCICSVNFQPDSSSYLPKMQVNNYVRTHRCSKAKEGVVEDRKTNKARELKVITEKEGKKIEFGGVKNPRRKQNGRKYRSKNESH